MILRACELSSRKPNLRPVFWYAKSLMSDEVMMESLFYHLKASYGSYGTGHGANRAIRIVRSIHFLQVVDPR